MNAFPGLPATLERLAPLGWAARGVALGWLVAAMIGTSYAFILMFVGIGLSVWWSLRSKPRGPAGRTLSAFATALAIVAIFPLAIFLADRVSRIDADYSNGELGAVYGPGLVQDGQQVTQLYAYDRDGRRLDDIRIYDQNGRPVLTSQDGNGDQWVDSAGRTWANVYPGWTYEGQGWTVSPGSGGWHPPMAIAPLATRIPSPVAVEPGDGSPDQGSWDPAAPTEVVPTSPSATVTATTPAATTTAPATPRPSGTATTPSGTATTR